LIELLQKEGTIFLFEGWGAAPQASGLPKLGKEVLVASASPVFAEVNMIY
jgi:hypothetical protein